MNSFRWMSGLALAVVVGAVLGACGSGGGASFDGGGGGGDGSRGDAGSDRSIGLVDSGGGDGTMMTGKLTITPANMTFNVTMGSSPPTMTYVAHLGKAVVPVSWSIDRGEIGSIGITSGLFTAGETVGGTANITATYGKTTASTPVTISLHLTENGGTSAADAGAGGNGGVGGNGPGGAVSKGTQGILQGTATADSTVGWLYPYDNTVWPQGILAPLLQWTAGSYDFDAVYIHISEAAFDYKGFFASTATPFINNPVTEDAWTTMAYSNAGEPVTVTLVFHDPASGKAIGPIVETWNIALGTLEGTVYYNSYGTNLALNLCCTYPDNGGGAPGNQLFGGATLAIKAGSTSPVLIAGTNAGMNDYAACRVCHSVAAGGGTLITEHGDSYPTSSAYDLKTLVETPMVPAAEGIFAWPALYPDGSFLFSNESPISGGSSTTPSGLYAVPGGTAIASTGLPSGLGAACPVFSPDGTHLAFNFWAGTGADQVSLAWMDFSQPKSAFSGFTTAYTPPSGDTVVWPSFFPTNDGLVFELQTRYNGRDFGGTRADCDPDTSAGCMSLGTQGELWWIDQATKTPTRLDQANGYMYLPTNSATNHATDWELNYEPTVNPVASGGYAWVVFTSRRMYGNVATVDPYASDPRYYDIASTPTTKKLWVAAIDLNPKAGTDPSHPAFYLPGQELLAGNSRGYWVVNPCLANGATCMTGDECCGGYCRADDAGTLVCGSMPMGCSQEYEKCTKTSDCCGASMGITCIDDICSESAPPK
jgi:hypothetical protein